MRDFIGESIEKHYLPRKELNKGHVVQGDNDDGGIHKLKTLHSRPIRDNVVGDAQSNVMPYTLYRRSNNGRQKSAPHCQLTILPSEPRLHETNEPVRRTAHSQVAVHQLSVA
mmetsp:Transcript_7905/g.9692  ORF Transcript_7905/g.9692 Transcript_7905/m.9692 type:complete len:112 (-) Transcript_7905:4-339(-)